MKTKRMMTALLIAAMTVALVACSESKPEPVVLPDNGNVTATSEETVSETVKVEEPSETTLPTSENTQTTDTSAQQAEGVVATITINCTYENGEPDIIEALDMPAVASQPGKDDDNIYGYDEAENLIYKYSATSVVDDNGSMSMTGTYEFYSLDYDFDFRVEPLNPENGGSIQTITGTYTAGNESTDYTWETVGIRGQTGIWYAGICSCRGGVLGAYELY